MNNAQILFQTFLETSDKEAYLMAWLDPKSPQCEEEWLEFKGCQDLKGTPKDLEDGELKNIWGENLSGFANTGGGVLVLGIDARKVPSSLDPSKQIDVANAFRPYSDPVALKSRLMEWHKQATEPAVMGVRCEAVVLKRGGGVVVCYIPRSKDAPHRVQFFKHKPYFIRVGDSTSVMPHEVLRRMFFPQASAKFCMSAEVVEKHVTAGQPKNLVYLDLTLENIGNISAKSVHIHVQPKLGHNCRSYFIQPIVGLWPAIYDGSGEQYSCTIPIHPSQKTKLTIQGISSDQPTQPLIGEFEIMVCAENGGPQKFRIGSGPEGFKVGQSTAVVEVSRDDEAQGTIG